MVLEVACWKGSHRFQQYRTLKVFLDGKAPGTSNAISGFPQDTAIESLLYLLLINGLPEPDFWLVTNAWSTEQFPMQMMRVNLKQTLIFCKNGKRTGWCRSTQKCVVLRITKKQDSMIGLSTVHETMLAHRQGATHLVLVIFLRFEM